MLGAPALALTPRAQTFPHSRLTFHPTPFQGCPGWGMGLPPRLSVGLAWHCFGSRPR